MPRPLLSCAALICCCLLLFAPSSPSSPSPSLAAASAEGAPQPERDATAKTTTTTTAAAQQRLKPTFSSSSSSTARRLGGGRVPASLGSRSLGSSIRLGRRRGGDGDDGNDDRRSSFSVVDSATATTTAPTSPRPRPSHHRRSSSRRTALPSTAAPTTGDIYVRTYSGDAAWLTWLLRSIEENVEEGAFRAVIVSVPRGDARRFESLLPLFRLRIVLLVVDDARFERATKATKSRTDNGGYHAQMFDKLTRPPLFSDADYFVHVDSDCVFKRQPVAAAAAKAEKRGEEKTFRKISRLDFVDSRGRVRARRVAFASLPGPFRRWQRAAEGMLLEPVPSETMSCFPLVFPRDVYGLVRDLVLERHAGGGGAGGGGGEAAPEQRGGGGGGGGGDPLLRVLSRQLDDFGEFTALGHVLTTRTAEGERWVPDDVEGGNGSFCSLAQQAWSWGSVTAEAAVEAERSLRVGW